MILARLAVYGAIACTLWFNASYAWSKGGSEWQQAGMVAVAVTIDLCKCGFLPAASLLWRSAWRAPALVLVGLWPLAFAYSTFSAYASITTNRATTSASHQAQGDLYRRAQADYDAATAALQVATTSPLWTTTAACTAPKTSTHRTFCRNIATTKDTQQHAATRLATLTAIPVDPDITVLSDTTGLPLPALLLVIALVPALILELVSSLGYYAVSRRQAAEASPTPVEGISEPQRGAAALRPQNVSHTRPDASGATSTRTPRSTPLTSPQHPSTDWAVP